MITRWYIEEAKGESWRSVSGQFMEWLVQNEAVDKFGFSEGDPISFQGKIFFSFRFPVHHGEKINFFERWAKTTGRIYGGEKNRIIQLSSGEKIELPPEPNHPIPPWLE